MSTINVEVVEVSVINPHPNADRLEVADILGTKCVIGKGTMQVGDLAWWFPPNILIPTTVGDHLGVTKYLKHALYPGDVSKTQCRVGATRLRGVPSYGFLVHIGPNNGVLGFTPGDDHSDRFNAVKYEPPAWTLGRTAFLNSDAAPDFPEFHRYTDIENFYKYPSVIADGTPVVMTEKIHGTNCRLGYVNVRGEWQFMAGSRKVNLKEVTDGGATPIYWRMMTNDIKDLLQTVSGDQRNVILFGEIYGPRVQDLDYGETEPVFRAFDLTVDGQYLNHADFNTHCGNHGVPRVPLIYEGPFSREILESHTHGETKVSTTDAIKSSYKGREGVVVKPAVESWTAVLGGRLILKSVSADYLDRRNAEDN